MAVLGPNGRVLRAPWQFYIDPVVHENFTAVFWAVLMQSRQALY